MWNVIKVKRTGQILYISDNGTWNNNLCEYIGRVKEKGQMP